MFQKENEGLIIAEIELEEENQKITKPNWLGKEISSDKRYYNCNLAEKPYSLWKL